MITEDMLKRAAQVFCDAGFEISLPSEGDLDDVERERYETLKAALTAALSDQVAVPKEPTEEMLIAGVIANQSRMVGDVYRAMIAAATPAGDNDV